MRSATDVHWRYMVRGRVRHAFLVPPLEGATSPCGKAPVRWSRFGWMGVACQRDRDYLMNLPPCGLCVRFLGVKV